MNEAKRIVWVRTQEVRTQMELAFYLLGCQAELAAYYTAEFVRSLGDAGMTGAEAGISLREGV